MKTRTLVIIEDSDEDFEMIEILVRELGFKHTLLRFDDGDAALEHLQKCASLPSLVLLDLNLPQLDGKEFLVSVRESERLRILPVVALTTSNNPKDVEFCYANGINAYALKPVDLGKLRELLSSLLTFWFDMNIYPEDLC